MVLAHDVTGSGTDVLLLHSSACDLRMWTPVVPALAGAGHRVIRCDFRGFGDSPPATGYDDADDVVALLDALGVDSAAVVGSSHGARVAQRLAIGWPARVGRLALLCPGLPGATATPDAVEFGEREEELTARRDVGGLVALYTRDILGPDADAATTELFAAMRRTAIEAQLAAGLGAPAPAPPHDPADVAAPTLLVSGGADLPYYRHCAELVAARIPDVRHVRLPWAHHLPSLERPAAILPLLLDFLAR